MNSSFALDRTNKKLFGVCAGLSAYTGVDVMLIRVGFALATLLGFGAPVLIYVLIALLADTRD